MIRIGGTIVSLDLLEKRFCCDLPGCHGSCCRYGESGAPLAPEEVAELKRIWPVVSEYVSAEGYSAVNAQGTSVVDSDGDPVTPLIGGMECAYAIVQDGVYYCAIEKSWSERRVKFRKPISCHLFPVRVREHPDFIAVNYEEISICEPGRVKGRGEGIQAYRFLKDALVRRFGKHWYKELELAAREWDNYNRKIV